MENDFAEDNYLKLHVKKVFKTRYDFELFSETIVDINEYEKLKASLKLMSQLVQGELAGKEKGWMTIEEVEAELGI
ncbi:hypothetical protein TEPIDINF_002637 [Tepidibacillus infernus]|uniref:hypothetical protein n=1 Tax=Tepidibacillus infernus TaxID=1806172 RepID=UPI003B698347